MIWNSSNFNTNIPNLISHWNHSLQNYNKYHWDWFQNINFIAKYQFIDQINHIFNKQKNNQNNHNLINVKAWFFDAWSLTKYRIDSHVWKVKDCAHYTNPSVHDTWNLMIYNYLIGNIF